MTLKARIAESFATLIHRAGSTNQANGYNGYAQALKDGYGTQYLAMKDLLEVSENSEALDELRAGRTPDEVYRSEGGKPEGYIVEKLDAIVRNLGTLFEVAQAHGVDTSDISDLLIEKMEYNARRSDTAKSGTKKF